MAGLVPAIPISQARHCPLKRDRRDKPGDDTRKLTHAQPGMTVRERYRRDAPPKSSSTCMSASGSTFTLPANG